MVFTSIKTEKNFSNVCSFEPGTVWTNNIHTEAMAKGIVEELGADCLLLVDYLLARDPAHLFRTTRYQPGAASVHTYPADKPTGPHWVFQ